MQDPFRILLKWLESILRQKGDYCKENVLYKQLKRIDGTAHNGIQKLSFFFFYCLSFLLQTTFLFFQLSEQSSQRENEVHSCILKEAFKVEYSSDKKEGELQLAWVWLNVYNLAV